MAGRSRKTGSRSAAASVAASSDPSRCLIASGPEKAFWTETCWSSAKPDEQGHRVRRDQRVGLVGFGEVEAIGHNRIVSRR
jgi:hypothetical protein